LLSSLSLHDALPIFLSHAGAPVEESLTSRVTSFPLMAGVFGIGIAAGLLGLVYFNRALFGRLRHGAHAPAPRNLAMAIATGLGLDRKSTRLNSSHVA